MLGRDEPAVIPGELGNQGSNENLFDSTRAKRFFRIVHKDFMTVLSQKPA